MAPQTYYRIYLQRSDGQGYQNDASTSEAVALTDDRLTRWRAIIGSHLKHQLGDPSDKKAYILAKLPDGYELREIKPKSTTDPTKTAVGNVYLFGHPTKIRYRTAGEFVPHILWLLSDSVDRNDCFCVPCMDMVRTGGRQVSASAPTTPAAEGAAPGAGGGAAPGLAPPRVGDTAAQQHAGPSQQTQQQHQQRQVQQAQHVLQTSQQPQYQQAQQLQQSQQYPKSQVAGSAQLDMGITSPSNVFRVAELVWFKEQAWRLAIILSISPTAPNSQGTPNDDKYIFTLAPLGHSELRKPNAAKGPAFMRPFLTFSVPASAKFNGKSFTEIDWRAEAEQARHKPDPTKVQQELEVLGLEASKVAARTINNCFSLFNRFDHRTVTQGGFSVDFYGGVFLGAEMIIVGDPVRVTPPPELASPDDDDKPMTVMCVDDIALLIPHTRGPAVTLQFRGVVYHLTRQPEHEINVASAAESQTTNLGTGSPLSSSSSAFKEEVDFRNSLLDPTDRQAHGRWTWKPVEKGTTTLRNDDGIQGRFYVSHKLMQIIAPDKLQAAMQTRVLPQESTLLNTRQQNGAGIPYAGRLLDRRACIGMSINPAALNLPAGVKEEFQAVGGGR